MIRRPPRSTLFPTPTFFRSTPVDHPPSFPESDQPVQSRCHCARQHPGARNACLSGAGHRSEEHTSELQSQSNLVCRLLLEKKKRITITAWHCSQHLTVPHSG